MPGASAEPGRTEYAPLAASRVAVSVATSGAATLDPAYRRIVTVSPSPLPVPAWPDSCGAVSVVLGPAGPASDTSGAVESSR